MKTPFSYSIRRFLLFSLGMCVLLVAGYLAVRGLPPSLRPTLIVAGIIFVAGISCVLIAGLLLLLSAQKEVREALGYIPQTDNDLNQGGRAGSSKVEKSNPLGISASVAVIHAAQDTVKKSLPAKDLDKDDRAA